MSSNILRYKHCSCPTGWLWEPTAVPRRFSACLAPESATQRATHTVRCCCALSSCMGFGTDLSKLRRFGITTPAAGSLRQHYTRPPSETWLSAGVFLPRPGFCVFCWLALALPTKMSIDSTAHSSIHKRLGHTYTHTHTYIHTYI